MTGARDRRPKAAGEPLPCDELGQRRDLEGDSFCAPGSPSEYYVHDQLVFTSDSCHSLLDRETSNAVVEIESTVRDAR